MTINDSLDVRRVLTDRVELLCREIIMDSKNRMVRSKKLEHCLDRIGYDFEYGRLCSFVGLAAFTFAVCARDPYPPPRGTQKHRRGRGWSLKPLSTITVEQWEVALENLRKLRLMLLRRDAARFTVPKAIPGFAPERQQQEGEGGEAGEEEKDGGVIDKNLASSDLFGKSYRVVKNYFQGIIRGEKIDLVRFQKKVEWILQSWCKAVLPLPELEKLGYGRPTPLLKCSDDASETGEGRTVATATQSSLCTLVGDVKKRAVAVAAKESPSVVDDGPGGMYDDDDSGGVEDDCDSEEVEAKAATPAEVGAIRGQRDDDISGFTVRPSNGGDNASEVDREKRRWRRRRRRCSPTPRKGTQHQ